VDSKQLRHIIEGALLASGQTLSLDKMTQLFEEESRPDKEEIQAALQDLEADCRDRSYELKRTASGYRFQVRQQYAPWISRLWEEKPKKYSRALLETLVLIAYRQPITRGDIEQVRGVAVSSDIIRTLMEREWVRVVGHRDVPGRPALYATTRQFLDYFNLKSLEELPPLGEIQDLDSINVEFDLSNNQSTEEDDESFLAPLSVAEEPSADKEPSADEEPSADKEPSAGEEASSTDDQETAESEPSDENKRSTADIYVLPVADNKHE
jgi:segregation and condensation protein B